MTLSEEAKARLADVVRLQPTKNRELMERWGMESGSEVHGYLENELKEYYYRDENSLIRATSEAADLVDVEPGVEADEGEGVPDVIRVPELEARVFETVAGVDERTESVVRVLNKLRDRHGIDPAVDEVRRALQSLRRKGVVEVEYRAVPTFRRSVTDDDVRVEVLESASTAEPTTAESPDSGNADSDIRDLQEELEEHIEPSD